jgi:hypothetical protein
MVESYVPAIEATYPAKTARATGTTPCIADWLSRVDRDGCLAAVLKPDLAPPNAPLRRWKAG